MFRKTEEYKNVTQDNGFIIFKRTNKYYIFKWLIFTSEKHEIL